MKCPKCRATNPILAKVCEACGYSPLDADLAEQEANNLGARINENLALLRTRAPSGHIGSFIVGFLLLPTMGLSWIVAKTLDMLGRPGKSAAKLELELGADMRASDTAYGSDPSFRLLLNQTKNEIEIHASSIRLAFKHFLTGLVAFILFALVAAGLAGAIASRHGVEIREKKKTEAKAEDKNANTILASLHAGNIENAAAQLRLLTPESLIRIHATQPEIAIVEFAAQGLFEEALKHARQITDPVARKAARSALAKLALAALAEDYDNTKAQTFAALIEPESKRLSMMDSILADQANRFIVQNRYQDARACIAGITSTELRAKLEAKIAERSAR